MVVSSGEKKKIYKYLKKLSRRNSIIAMAPSQSLQELKSDEEGVKLCVSHRNFGFTPRRFIFILTFEIFHFLQEVLPSCTIIIFKF